MINPIKCNNPEENAFTFLTIGLFNFPFASVRKYKNDTKRPLVKKKVSTLKVPLVMVWKINSL